MPGERDRGLRPTHERQISKLEAVRNRRDLVGDVTVRDVPSADGRHRRRVNRAANRDRSPGDVGVRVNVKVASDDQDIARHRAVDRGIASEDDDGRAVGRVAGEDCLSGAGGNDDVRTGKHLLEHFRAGPEARIDDANDWALGVREPAPHQQGGKRSSNPHRASSRKFLSSAFPFGVITDSG